MLYLCTQTIRPGELREAFADQLDKARRINLIDKIITKRVAVFGKLKQTHQKIISDRLGWIDVIEKMKPEVNRIEQLASDVKRDGFCHVLILGMGGSSLCPEVLGEIFGRKKWLKSYDIVDTTAPSQMTEILNRIDIHRTFFIVSSKSGATMETMSQYRFFFRKIKESRPLKAGQYFTAVTDEGSELHRIARRNRFRDIFLNPKDIGGRYSALSYFGLVPGAFTAVNLTGLLSAGSQQLDEMKAHGDRCDALQLGLLLGVGAKAGYDRVRFVTDRKLAPFITWIEQLLAESTGKENKGIIPIEGGLDGEPPSGSLLYVYYTLKGEEKPFSIPGEEQKTPHVIIEVPDRLCLGAEMMKWEMATAVASTLLGINPFDEPNVAESKRNTTAILKTRRGPRKEIPVIPLARLDDIDIISASGIKGMKRRRQVSPIEILAAFLKGVRKEDYLAILCYTERDDRIESRLTSLRALIARKYGIVALRGYGPRFLHSTGQLFKGGSQKGHFLVLDREYETDYDIPTMNISFARLIKAQARGDMKALRKRGRPVIHVNLNFDPASGLNRLAKLISDL